MVLVESAMSGGETSAAGAAGLWQFTPATAKAYGLKVTKDHDERLDPRKATRAARSEEHTSELQSLRHLVCRLLLEKKKKEVRTDAQYGGDVADAALWGVVPVDVVESTQQDDNLGVLGLAVLVVAAGSYALAPHWDV